VYASAEHLYVAAPEWFDWSAPRPLDDVPEDVPDRGTDIHRFDITGPAATYEMSGHVDGTLLDPPDASKGCFEKLETKAKACLTTDDTAARAIEETRAWGAARFGPPPPRAGAAAGGADRRHRGRPGLAARAVHRCEQTLREWLATRPADALFDASLEVLKSAFSVLPGRERHERIEQVIDACRIVAEASGTEIAHQLGLGTGVSRSEASLLEAIKEKLRARD